MTKAAGFVRWPWFDKPIPDSIMFDRQQIVDNALVYAAAWCRIDAANLLLARGANINARPAGFDFTGTPLHYAALNGRWKMTAFLLEHGADPAAPFQALDPQRELAQSQRTLPGEPSFRSRSRCSGRVYSGP